MVDKQHIEALVHEHFKVGPNDKIQVDDDGVVNVSGDLKMRSKHIQEIPVQFGTVDGTFDVTGMNIASLKGSPQVVGGTFSCVGNNLTTLEGGPKEVHGFYHADHNQLTDLKGCATRVDRMLSITHNPLKSLEGLTPGVSHIKLTYNEHMPLLRLLDLPGGFQIPAPDQESWDYSEPPWEKILEPYMGEGRKGAIKAAAELVKAGYKENARW